MLRLPPRSTLFPYTTALPISALMAKLKLSMISARNERTEALTDGIIDVEGVEIVHTYSDPSETFWRQLNFWEYQISEMSLSDRKSTRLNSSHSQISYAVFCLK